MINHARTLLLNLDGPREVNPTIPGDVYIPEYEAATLTEPLQSVYQQLFGTTPDYEGQLYRMVQYMDALHSTEFEAYVLDLDSRLTYDPKVSTAMSDGNFGTLALDYSDQRMTVTGEWNSTARTGRKTTEWHIDAVGGNFLTVQNVTDGLSSVQEAYAGTTLFLTGSTLVFNIEGTSLVSGDRWEVRHNVRPEPSIAAITSELRNPTDVVEEALYGSTIVDQIVEPYRSFYNLSQQHYAMPYQLSGILLAYIYRVEALR
jgi:hypothetical protein